MQYERIDHGLRVAAPEGAKLPETAEPLKPAYGECDRCHGLKWIPRPTALLPVTGLHGLCQTCIDREENAA